ncbi:hypothetical protein L1049_003420 [Liquidambar formosana]|uniref:Zinc knuckle CX2CX4HX4C domain-containing protein n=1 Tax=Liquidambar formosana TaxID=63359 RepID=A0AAP0QXP6_LIQFO
MGSHLVLICWRLCLVLEELDFSRSQFWIQIHGLSLGNKTTANATKIGNMIGKFISVDSHNSNGLFWESFLRIKVDLLISNPLKTGFVLKRDALPPVWIQFKYERLSDFCFHCGRLSHCANSCLFVPKDIPTESSNLSLLSPGFGPWLRAEGGPSHKKSPISRGEASGSKPSPFSNRQCTVQGTRELTSSAGVDTPFCAR